MSGFNYSANETVLCYHGPLIYEAKILKTEFRDQFSPSNTVGPHYFVHYKGWNDKWDEWVPESRLLKHTDENLQKQKSLTSVVKSNRKSGPGGNGPTSEPKKFKKKETLSTPSLDQEEDVKVVMKLAIPDILKTVCVDDWEIMSKNQKLVRLPAPVLAVDILTAYKNWAFMNGSLKKYDSEVVNEICEGILEYFNFAIGTLLLYSFERVQYKEALKKYSNQTLSNVYGAVHLLRLLTKMPMIVAQIELSNECMDLLKDHFNDIFKFLEENVDGYFNAHIYEYASPDYIAKSKAT